MTKERINIFQCKYRIWINFQICRVESQEHSWADLMPLRSYQPITRCSQDFPRRQRSVYGWLWRSLPHRPLLDGALNGSPSHVFLPSPSRLALTVAIHKPFEGDIPPYATTVISTFFMHEGDGYRERVCCVMGSWGAVVPRPHSRAGWVFITGQSCSF